MRHVRADSRMESQRTSFLLDTFLLRSKEKYHLIKLHSIAIESLEVEKRKSFVVESMRRGRRGEVRIVKKFFRDKKFIEITDESCVSRLRMSADVERKSPHVREIGYGFFINFHAVEEKKNLVVGIAIINLDVKPLRIGQSRRRS